MYKLYNIVNSIHLVILLDICITFSANDMFSYIDNKYLDRHSTEAILLNKSSMQDLRRKVVSVSSYSTMNVETLKYLHEQTAQFNPET